jgi:hypothetical protein
MEHDDIRSRGNAEAQRFVAVHDVHQGLVDVLAELEQRRFEPVHGDRPGERHEEEHGRGSGQKPNEVRH